MNRNTKQELSSAYVHLSCTTDRRRSGVNPPQARAPAGAKSREAAMVRKGTRRGRTRAPGAQIWLLRSKPILQIETGNIVRDVKFGSFSEDIRLNIFRI